MLIFLNPQNAPAFAVSFSGSVTIDVEERSRSATSGGKSEYGTAIWVRK
jgi:hypothetical protein